MIKFKLFLLLCCTLVSLNLLAQKIDLSKERIENVQVNSKIDRFKGKKVVWVIKDSSVKAVDEPTFVKIKELDFNNGTIEVDVLSRILPDAPELSRGFIGVAFRINDDNSAFEGVYLRPANATDSLRRNHTLQYFSYPDYKFDRLRNDNPGKYEGYADVGLDQWINLKIVVLNKQAMLFVNGNKQSSLVINDLKHGIGNGGAIGLWVDVGTEAFFSNLKITKNGQ